MADPVGLLHLHAAFAKWEFLFHGHGSRHWVFFVTNLDWTVVSWGFHLEIRSNPLVEQLHQWLKTAATQRHCPHTPILLKGISSLRWIWYPPIPNIYIYIHIPTHISHEYITQKYWYLCITVLDSWICWVIFFAGKSTNLEQNPSGWLVTGIGWLVGFLVREGDLTNMVGYQGLSHMTRLLCYEIGWFFRESHLFLSPFSQA